MGSGPLNQTLFPWAHLRNVVFQKKIKISRWLILLKCADQYDGKRNTNYSKWYDVIWPTDIRLTDIGLTGLWLTDIWLTDNGLTDIGLTDLWLTDS